MENTKPAVKRQLREDWEKACNGYLVELLRMWELDGYFGYWVGDEVGGIYDYDGYMCISMDSIIYCVEHDVTKEEYREWQEYCVKCHEYNLPTLNLNAWHKGAPRHDFTKLDELKKELNDAIDNEKNKF